MDSKPLIAVTGAGHRMAYAWWATSFILRILGAKPVHLTPQHAAPAEKFDAIIIGGGEDIDPMLYGENRAEFANTDAARDIFEVGMIKQSIAAKIPMLGICRGSQLINVVKGGTLHLTIRHWRKQTSNRSTPFPRKTALITKKSRLASLLGCEICRINSLHHQAVEFLGNNLRVAAHDLDGFVQAIESTNDHFIIGTQWHPEYLPYLPVQRRVFKALIAAAKEFKK
jgi:putative glutamine amidotransferase